MANITIEEIENQIKELKAKKREIEEEEKAKVLEAKAERQAEVDEAYEEYKKAYEHYVELIDKFDADYKESTVKFVSTDDYINFLKSHKLW